MTTKQAAQQIINTLLTEINNNPKVNYVENIDAMLNGSLLASGHRESYNNHVENDLLNAQAVLENIHNIQEIPKTLELFKDYWQACKTS